MSNAAACTVSDLLPNKFDRMEEAVDSELASDPELSQNRWPRMVRRMIATKATQAVLDALNQSVLLILPGAWARAPELGEYSDPALHPSDEETIVHLGEHKFVSDYTPLVNVRIFKIDIPLLMFKLIFSAEVRGASIKIRNGHIVEIGECDCAVEAELKHIVGPVNKPIETVFHAKLKSREIKLIDGFKLTAPGVAISPLRRSPTAASPSL
jgi:hypothetical protein